MRRYHVLAAVVLAASPGAAAAQQIFHSVQSANIPTAETLARGAWLFEISHRFDLPVSEGASALWGLDGPVRNRMGLTYSVSDRAMLGVLRTNLQDNVELNAKVVPFEGGPAGLPVKVGVMAGIAWNTAFALAEGAEDNEVQLYGQLILNARIGDRFAIGVVPTYVRNPRVRDFDAENGWAVGLNGQLYLTPSMSLLAEWIVSEDRLDLATTVEAGTKSRDPATFGIEFETRGHFFKLVLTNQPRMNPTQVLPGAPLDFEPGEWRPGFNITRLLPF